MAKAIIIYASHTRSARPGRVWICGEGTHGQGHNYLCVAYTLGPPRPRVDLGGGDPCIRCIFIPPFWLQSHLPGFHQLALNFMPRAID